MNQTALLLRSFESRSDAMSTIAIAKSPGASRATNPGSPGVMHRIAACALERLLKTADQIGIKSGTEVEIPLLPRNPIDLRRWSTLFDAVSARFSDVTEALASEAGSPNPLSAANYTALLECVEAFGQLRIMFPNYDPQVDHRQRTLLEK